MFLEEVDHWEWVVAAYGLAPLLAGSLSVLWVEVDVISQLPATTACCHSSSAIMGSPPGTIGA